MEVSSPAPDLYMSGLGDVRKGALAATGGYSYLFS